MEKQFIPHNLALKLKELGFNEECLAFYSTDGQAKLFRTNPDQTHNNSYWYLSAPLWQQAFDFIRNKFNIFGYIFDDAQTGQYWWGFSKSFSGETEEDTSETANQSYEIAQEECLERMINYIEINK